MKTCGKCGAELKESVKYCKSCGSASLLQEKKARVMSEEKSWVKPTIIAAVVLVVMVGGWMYRESRASNPMGDQSGFSPQRDASARFANARPVTVQEGEVRIPVAGVDDGNAHFFAYPAGQKTVTFFVMKASDGSIRTAFDACTACNHAKLGYRQEGNAVVCNNCGMSFKPSDIGKRTGGCNPIPIEKTADDRMIVVKAKDLEAGVQYF
jgi:uncharacterized membrane protein